MYSKSDPIGVFDSGVGGISVLKELVRLMPREKYLYFGDSANAPYGVRPTEEVRQLTLDAAESLMQRGIKALVLACNTATSAAVNDLRQRYPDMIIVGIEPALKMAADRFPNGHIGVMATPVTLAEEKFATQFVRFPDATVSPIPAPGLVELIEMGITDGAEVEALLRPLLEPLAGKLDAVVLGCTHFPFIRHTISQLLGPRTVVLDGSEGTARQTLRRLGEAGLLSDGPGTVQIENSLPDSGVLTRCMTLLQEDAHG